jgi:hypothetical protein
MVLGLDGLATLIVDCDGFFCVFEAWREIKISVMCCGLFRFHKVLDTFLTSFYCVKNTRTDVVLVITLGDNSKTPSVRVRYESEGIENLG